MRPILNKTPFVAYPKEAYLALIEEGYALPIGTEGNATVLLFRDVEDHIDGNGVVVLWMIEGEGTFLYDGTALALNKGDVVVFDDNVEHGFEARDYCVAVNFEIGPEKEPSVASIAAMLAAFEAQQNAKPTVHPISQTAPSI